MLFSVFAESAIFFFYQGHFQCIKRLWVIFVTTSILISDILNMFNQIKVQKSCRSVHGCDVYLKCSIDMFMVWISDPSLTI